MIKIQHIITGLNVGGAEMMLYKLLAQTNRTEFSHEVVCLVGRGALTSRIESLGITVHSLGMRGGPGDVPRLLRIARHVRAMRPDVIQTWLYHADFVGLLAARLAGRVALAWNIRCYDPLADDHSRLMPALLRILARASGRPDVVVINSNAGRLPHERLGYRPREWRVIPNGFDVSQFRPRPEARAALREELGLDPAVPIIGLVGRYNVLKDHATFLTAAALLRGAHGAVHFVLVGDDVNRENAVLMDQVHELGLDGAVHLLGRRDDVAAITAGFDIATSSSSGEGFSNVIGEAMACAVPCVVTDVGDSAAVVGETGDVVPPRDPAALAGAWQRILSLGPRREQLGRAARERVVQNFSIEAVVQRYEDMYRGLVSRTAA